MSNQPRKHLSTAHVSTSSFESVRICLQLHNALELGPINAFRRERASATLETSHPRAPVERGASMFERYRKMQRFSKTISAYLCFCIFCIFCIFFFVLRFDLSLKSQEIHNGDHNGVHQTSAFGKESSMHMLSSSQRAPAMYKP